MHENAASRNGKRAAPRPRSRRAFLQRVAQSAALMGLSRAGHSRGKIIKKSRAAAPVGYDQPLRPQFHFTARTGWINDPNGLVYVAGKYHLFFQFNPDRSNTASADKSWGHAISSDLVHWRQLPVALKPDRRGNIWSGSAVVDRHNTGGFQTGKEPAVVAFYTAAGGTSALSKGQPFTQCVAYSNNHAMSLTKYAKNPVIENITPGDRDPKVIWYEPTRHWIMALFLDGRQGFALLKSTNLKQWRKIQEIHFPQSRECPNFFPLRIHGRAREEKWIFTGANGKYLIGEFNGERFTPQAGPFAMDTGKNFYASQVFSDLPDNSGNAVQITWMANGHYPNMPFNQQLGFPCVLSLHDTPHGLRIFRFPVEEISRLRTATHTIRDKPLGGRSANSLLKFSGELLDVELTLAVGRAKRIDVTLGKHLVSYTPATGVITALGASGVAAAQHGVVTLRLLLDRTSLEIFGNQGEASMTSCLPPKSGPHHLRLQARGAGARIISLAVHTLKSAWVA